MPLPVGESGPSGENEITRLLRASSAGEPGALDRLFHAVYDELKRLAHGQRARWEGDYTLNTTALVHEAYLKLVRQQDASWDDRGHFFAVAGKAMRHILVNYAEHRQAQKRGGSAVVVSLDDANPVAPEVADEILALNAALEELATIDERQSRVVECRFFAGLPIQDTAEALGVSPATVKRDWTVASAWLRREMGANLTPATDRDRPQEP